MNDDVFHRQRLISTLDKLGFPAIRSYSNLIADQLNKMLAKQKIVDLNKGSVIDTLMRSIDEKK